MNERIKQLAEQATECYSNGQERTFNKEKFAQLIVQECIRECEYARDSDALNAAGAIKELFGVDE